MRYLILYLVLLLSVNAYAFDAKFSAEVQGSFTTNNLTFRNLETRFNVNTVAATGKMLTANCITKYTFAQGFKNSQDFNLTDPFELGGISLVEKATGTTTTTTKPKPLAFTFSNPYSHTLEFCYVDGRLKPLFIVRHLGVTVEAVKIAEDGKLTTATETFTRTNYAAGGAGYYSLSRNLVVEGKAAFSDRMQYINLGLSAFNGPDFFAHVGWQYEQQRLGDMTLKTSAPFVGLQYNF